MLHPTVRLIAWGVAVTLVQWSSFGGLWLACAAALIAGAWFATKRLGLLLRRTRWLMVCLLLLFALATPGVYLLPQLGSLGPTEEGVRLGFEHLLRLLFVVATLAVLLESTGAEGLVAGLHGLILPLAWLGLDRGRVALRLLLVMQYVEHSAPGRQWREWLGCADDDQAIGVVSMRQPRFSLLDFAVLAGLTFGVITFFGGAS